MTRFPIKTSIRLFLALAVVYTGAAGADNYRSVQADSQLQFISRFEGEEAPGEFKRFDVEVQTDPETAGPGAILVLVDVTSATMGSPDLDAGMAEPEWFDFASIPQAKFQSERIEAKSESEFLVTGFLQLKGVRQPVSLSIRWLSQSSSATLSGTAELSRLSFGIGSGEWSDTTSIEDKVVVRFSISLAKTGR